jgi:subtilisin family serine protease
MRIEKNHRAIAAFCAIFALSNVIAAASSNPAEAKAEPASPKSAGTAEIYLVRLSDAPVAGYEGGIGGLTATSPRALGQRRLQARSAASEAYRGFLLQRQNDFLDQTRQLLGREVEVAHRYVYANNGLAILLTAAEAARVAKLPGVVFIQKDFERELMTDHGPLWINAPSIWDGTATGGLPGTRGEGVIIGVIDTGINPSNPSFADIGPIDGYDHVNPRGAGNYVGVCDPGDPLYDSSFPCNDKLIGARGYPSTNGGDPRDSDGHGSHTASTAAGNQVVATVNAPDTSYTATISGVAPHANVIAYAACCAASSLAAAIEDVVIDGVDVVNYSIGSSTPSALWNDFDAVGFLNARAAGIFVATSAGNAGPGDDTVGSPADAPWLLSVGSATHDRKFRSDLINLTGGTPPGDLSGRALTGDYGPAPIVHAEDAGDALCLNPFPAGTWVNGEIVVCNRGIIARVEKGANVLAGGAGGFVLANTAAEGESVNADPHVLPAVHLGVTASDELRAWLSAPFSNLDGGDGVLHMAQIQTSIDVDPSNGDIMAVTSSRGANRAAPDILVPSVVAPGVDILAAYGTDDAIEYGVISGTSMASPHAAGAAALLTALHPSWTPAEIQSALMLTANTAVLDDDGSTPATAFDKGNGRIDLSTSAQSGLLMDETEANYWAADPSLGGAPRSLNLASLADSACCNCSWTRTFEAVEPASYDVLSFGLPVAAAPSSFTLAAGQTQTVVFTASTGSLPSPGWSFGLVEVSETTGTLPTLRLPVAVQPPAAISAVSTITIEASDPIGAEAVPGLISARDVTNLTAEVHGLARGTVAIEYLTQDPTNGDPYDNLDDGTTFVVPVVVPAGGRRLVAEIIASTAPDMDLYVGSGTTPSAATQLCASTTASFIEYCKLDDPAPGDYWILVQSWTESPSPPDEVRLSYAVVGPGSTEHELSVSGPATAPACDPLDISLSWHVATPRDGERYYGLATVGSSAGAPDDIAVIDVALVFDKVRRWLLCESPGLAIPDLGSVFDTTSTTENLSLTNLDVHIDASHTWVGDLIFTLEHVGGATATLIDRPGVPLTTVGCGEDDIDVIVDDEGTGDIETQCDLGPAISGNRVGGDPPAPVMSAFIGENLGGDWILTVSDNANQDTGSLVRWCLDVDLGLIFEDGFESSDTSMWSSTTP